MLHSRVQRTGSPQHSAGAAAERPPYRRGAPAHPWQHHRPPATTAATDTQPDNTGNTGARTHTLVSTSPHFDHYINITFQLCRSPDTNQLAIEHLPSVHPISEMALHNMSWKEAQTFLNPN